MPKTVYTAIDPNGEEHKRTTADRTYTHTVVYQRSKDAAIARAKDARKGHVDSGNYYLGCVRDGHYANLMKFEHYRTDAARQASDAADAAAKMAGRTAEEYADAKVAEHLAAIEATDWTVYHNAGWCGRHDLALKLAAKIGPSAVILPATAK
ncbi:hypothetical protein LB565_04285 [Mesorhizobium sp. CA14]|uniref:hypothetical protein n=1 Tax=Mesorhizobium sp. CA14 TaxID=2876642 RepID=UPI001CCCEEF3|nr:hypothetical protein [Mesorhizobium sp. CA14]MBZ9847206.1 hypothetical protein [Mesorhizobium sp. CA14]